MALAHTYEALRKQLPIRPACINREPHHSQMLADEYDLACLRRARFYPDGITVQLVDGSHVSRIGHWKDAWDAI